MSLNNNVINSSKNPTIKCRYSLLKILNVNIIPPGRRSAGGRSLTKTSVIETFNPPESPVLCRGP